VRRFCACCPPASLTSKRYAAHALAAAAALQLHANNHFVYSAWGFGNEMALIK
jgi:hypothetical protein